MVSTVKSLYGSETTIAVDLASLANSATVGVISDEIDNTTNLYLDALVLVQVKPQSYTPANDRAVHVFVSSSQDGSAYTGASISAYSGAKGAFTIGDPTTLRHALAIPIPTADATKTYRGMFSVGELFGGAMPAWWAIVVVNFSGGALSATAGDHKATYRGLHQQIV